ncbi:MAG: flagellar hook assembly protein FlgD [Hyphomicrobiales bacterium]|nr:flagellar hook assembly protein FlgD [Hyphomicrobiales bacterium]
MQVTSATSSAQAANAATSAATTKTTAPTLDYNAFLQLLLAQMKNQDPTSPTDSTQWVSQLATFSSVEQQVQANAKLDSLLTSSNLQDAEALVGHTLTSADGQTTGVVASVSVTSSGSTANLVNGGTIAITSGITVS